MAEADSVKERYMQSTGQANFVLRSIESDPKWKWGQTEVTQGKVKQLLTAVETKARSMDDIGMKFLAGCQVADLVDHSGEVDVVASLQRVKADMSSEIEALSRQLEKVGSAHTIMSKH